ncbi:ATP-binding protein involved in chromosome partitioning [Microbacterium terrae]|uniref:Iron-sulfur cluster carrier protein n=1 Tax=Microbacterium terrae TaxID=69369 RepID=A0A0M2H1D7_9MICO|nr:P-loop NTPase [Microbacterium terrae]KJL40032.1 Flagellum site-determining protein YlxH [Microbacterium terrae]MBP1076972.1 ATP-binding protein involved in chromosome partitioning [Microbacterium terrae]GLJ99566.1 iron-sulfur cluster carrier protein [Microbacterium terrae]
MSTPSVDDVRRAVAAVTDPELRRPIGDLDMVRRIDLDGAVARVGIVLTIAGCPAAERISSDVRAAAASVPGVDDVELEVGVMTPEERRALTEKLRDGRAPREMPFGPDSLTRIIAVTSGKGGVGKSTLTANLAVALAERGLAVGLIDADVHGFSIPGLLGLVSPDGSVPQPTRIDDLMLPPVAHGVKVISIGMFLRRSESDGPLGAVAWRGPMLHRTVQQFLTDVHFGDLDVLLLDMPPGTGDVAISVGQLLPHAEVLVVTTPQSAASDVAVRSAVVARQTGQRVIGVIENMAAMTLPDGSTLDLFGAGGGAEVAESLSAGGESVPLLGSVPLSPALRAGGDAGAPVVVGAPTDAAAEEIRRIAASLATSRRGLAGRSLPLRLQ